MRQAWSARTVALPYSTSMRVRSMSLAPSPVARLVAPGSARQALPVCRPLGDRDRNADRHRHRVHRRELRQHHGLHPDALLVLQRAAVRRVHPGPAVEAGDRARRLGRNAIASDCVVGVSSVVRTYNGRRSWLPARCRRGESYVHLHGNCCPRYSRKKVASCELEDGAVGQRSCRAMAGCGPWAGRWRASILLRLRCSHR